MNLGNSVDCDNLESISSVENTQDDCENDISAEVKTGNRVDAQNGTKRKLTKKRKMKELMRKLGGKIGNAENFMSILQYLV